MSIPNIYVFNPTCEIAVANGSETYMAPAILRRFESDLCLIQQVFCSSEDYILSERHFAPKHQEMLTNCGFSAPKTIHREDLQTKKDVVFNTIIPWGWSPAAHFQLKEIKKLTTASFQQSLNFCWKDAYKLLYERGTSARFLSGFMQENPDNTLFPQHIEPQIVRSIAEVEDLLQQSRQLVLKAPLSSSGRGVQILRYSQLNKSICQWIDSTLKQQSYLTVETLFNKQLDLSFQFFIDESGKASYLGPTYFQTNSNGMYQGTWLGKTMKELLPHLPVNFTEELLSRIAGLLKIQLEKSEYGRLHRGYLGIDGMVVMEDGKLKLHPCIEINSRMTMGLVAQKSEKQIHESATGSFHVYSGQEPFNSFCTQMLKSHPPIVQEQGIAGGFLPLTGYSANEKFGAYLLLEQKK